MRLLIVKMSALGDIVHALPVLAYLKSAAPEVEIDWLVEEGFASLLHKHPLIRKVHPVRMKFWRQQGLVKSFAEIRRFRQGLRQEKYDIVLDLQGNSKSGLFTLFSGAPLRYGFGRDGVREWPNLLSTNRHALLGTGGHHISERTLTVARAALSGGAANVLAGPLSPDAEALASVDRLLQAQDLSVGRRVVLHYGTTWKTKLWSLDHWRQLVLRLVNELDLRPILTWGNDDERQAAETINEAGSGKAVIWPRGSLPELVALLARADLVIGGDTGPVHIAAAVGTPTVSLYRVTDSRRNGPRGERHILLQAPLECSPCLRKSCERDAECGRSISVEEVFRAVERQLDARKANQ